MTVRRAGAAVPVDRDALAAAFPGASGRLVVFLHGLTDNRQRLVHASERHRHRRGVT